MGISRAWVVAAGCLVLATGAVSAGCVRGRASGDVGDAAAAPPVRAAQLAGAAAGAAASAPGPATDGDVCPVWTPGPGFKERAPQDEASAAGQGTPATEDGRLVVVSYNLWELYDGRDGDSYLGRDDHPEWEKLDEAHASRRVAALAAPLSGLAADVFVFQEVEDAGLACAVAHAADPASSWNCWAGNWAHEPHPQNVAVAARIPGAAVQLNPGRGMGQRGVLEFAPEGAAVRIAAVHLKSSVGAAGARDCGNAAKRMAVAWGLRQRQESLAGPAYLIVGDFNVDPADPAKIGYDRTDDILAEAGDEDLLSRFPAEAAAGGGRYRTIIDRAFLRPGAGVVVDDLRFLDAPTGGWASDHRPLVVVLRSE
ncbi:MAG: hypothetical protein HY905_22365 [Deltaproteobacteria bacterium]|nr:hypothetical protein [Deltaproteobacteria bacterium]